MNETNMIGSHITNNLSDCTGCGACRNICKQNAIEMEFIDGFLYPKINYEYCTRCGVCHKICPVNKEIKQIYSGERDCLTISYAIQNRDEDARLESSSGGVFSALAEQIIKIKGAIYGVRYTPEFQTEHICVTNSDSLRSLRGSKYVQSDVGLTMREAKTMLEKGRFVLFSGTPCQVSGLKSYLEKDYENLICVDVVCHGSPSPLVWKKYISYRMKDASSKTCPSMINMRSKKTGWTHYAYSMEISFDNGTKYLKKSNNDPYMRCFAGDICLRESCYHCNYRKVVHDAADLTLADFWGVQKYYPEMDDNKGTSLVLVQTQKGKTFLEECADYIKFIEIDLNKVIDENTAIFQQPKQSRHRLKQKFMRSIIESSFEQAYRKTIIRLYYTKSIDKLKVLIK